MHVFEELWTSSSHQTENAAIAHEKAFTPDAFYFSSGRKRKLSEFLVPDFIALLVKYLGNL